MATAEKAPGVDDSPESCPELDDEYFAQIDECFDVIDVWEDKSNDASGPSHDGEIKTEPGESSESRPSKDSNSSKLRRESERSRGNIDPRAGRSRDKENDKRSKSPERHRRSPYRRPSRFSPPGRRLQRSRSPRHSRRDSPPRRNQSNRPSFFEEITKQIPEIKRDMIRNNMQSAFNNNAQNFGFAMQPMMPQLMPTQSFVPFMQPQQFQNGAMMNAFGQHQQFPMNQVNNNGMMNQQMMHEMPGPMVPTQMMCDPIPVPAPQPFVPHSSEFKNPPKDPRQDPRKKQQLNTEQEKRPETTDYQQAKKKAFEERKISLAEYLRQVSHQSTKDAAVADMKSKRERVQERCKNAAKLLDELGANKTKLPFILCPSTKSLPAMKSDPKLGWKSPLVMSDNNAHFFSQAKEHNCREAFQANPLRNIAGKMFQFGRNLGLDLVTISQQVQRQANLEREQELRRAEVAEISSATINTILKKSQHSTQTDFTACRKCEKREAIKVETRSTQVKMPGKEISTQYEPDPKSFTATLCARTIQTMSREQHIALITFCSAFDIDGHRFEQIGDRVNHRERDDRLLYTNPENPNVDDMFVSFDSPVRESPQSSPKRKPIIERLGQKIQSPLRQQFHDDGPSRYFGYSASTYTIPSPPMTRNDRYNRPERLSPRGHRKRSRSRSLSPLPRSHKRSRSPIFDRRGRY